VREALKTSSAASFRKPASVFFRVGEGEIVLHTDHGPETKRAGEPFVLERLFTMICAARCTVVHPALGTLALPAGTEASSYDLPRYLTASAEATLASLVEHTAAADPKAIGQLEPMIALAHRLVRTALVTDARLAGRPELQMLLTTLDE
jgi:hypothetical protein